MNNLTKEELKRLLLRSFAWVGHSENQNDDEIALINKIQSMIDNYCEHDYAYVYEKIKLCLKCNRSME